MKKRPSDIGGGTGGNKANGERHSLFTSLSPVKKAPQESLAEFLLNREKLGFAAVAGGHRLVGVEIHGVRQKPDVPVGQEELGSTGMETSHREMVVEHLVGGTVDGGIDRMFDDF